MVVQSALSGTDGCSRRARTRWRRAAQTWRSGRSGCSTGGTGPAKTPADRGAVLFFVGLAKRLAPENRAKGEGGRGAGPGVGSHKSRRDPSTSFHLETVVDPMKLVLDPMNILLTPPQSVQRSVAFKPNPPPNLQQPRWLF